MSTGKLITGVVAGAAIGAVLGVLFAPDKGTETRKKLAQKGTDLTGAVKDRVGKFGEAVSSKFASVKDDANQMIEAGKEKASSYAKDGARTQPV